MQDIISLIKKVSKRPNVISYTNAKVSEWLSWYIGKVRKFHRYSIFNGKKRVPMERLSLGLAKKSCEDWANLLCNEKTDITLTNEQDQKTLEQVFANCDFWRKANGGVEKTFALGTGAFVVGVKGLLSDEQGNIVDVSKAEPTLQFINATKIYPITFENDKITECAFVNENLNCVLISIHLLNEQGEYEIHNLKCNKQFSYKEEDYTIFNTYSSVPLFQILKPNIENNVDINSPMGISVYANAVDILKSVDLSFDCMFNELNLGRKRIFISTKALKVDPLTGDTLPVFDQNDVEYYALPEAEDGKQLITDNTQQLRVDQLEKALQQFLNLYSASVGFGQNHYKFDSGTLSTATQVVSENSELFRTIKKHEILLNDVLVGLVKAFIVVINNFTNLSIGENNEIAVKFDDSIIEDKESEKASDRLDLQNGIISRAEYRAKYYNEDITLAEEKIREIAQQNNNSIISELATMRNDISQRTALELNPYIEDVESELKRISEEASSSIKIPSEYDFDFTSEENAEISENKESANE